MRIQVIFLILSTSTAAASGPCFNFETKIVKPLRAPIALVQGVDAADKGTMDEGAEGRNWAVVRAKVDKSLDTVYQLLLDHKTTSSPRVAEMTVEKIESPSYLQLEQVKFLIKPFLFVRVRWTEEWGFALAEGTRESPREIVISYEKTEGTSHIEHLCGNMVLRKLTDKSTDVFLYEEAKATNRKATDTLNGLLGTLKTLRK